MRTNYHCGILNRTLVEELEKIRKVNSPSFNSYFFFIDEDPYANWAHSCKYCFVNTVTGEVVTINSDFPPDLGKMEILHFIKIQPKGKLFDFSDNYYDETKTYTDNDYAVIISGGGDKYGNWERYWNDCAAMYSVLVDIYGYDDDHIYVIMSDGTNSGDDRRVGLYSFDSSPLDLDGDGDDDIQYSATKSNITSVFNTLKNILDSDDHLFIFTTDHGGQESGDDVFIVLWGDTMRDDEFADEVDKINAGRINVVMEQCHSGGFIDDLSATNRVIATACEADEPSYPMGRYTYNEFVYHWISAVAGETPDGDPVDADTNNDNWVSMREAFVYAELNDAQNETPQYNSTPDELGCYVSLDPYISWINGPSLVCTSNKTFLIYQRPPGTTVSWTKSSNLQYVSGQGTSYYTVKTISPTSGAAWVRATININGCDAHTLPDFNTWAGTPQITNKKVDGYSYYPGFQICPGNHYLNVTPGGDGGTATWTVPYGIVYSVGINELDFTFPSDASSIAITARSTNTCGTGPNSSFYLTKKTWGCSGYYAMTLSPNPASDYVNITMLENQPLIDYAESGNTTVDVDAKTYEPTTYTINIYNNQSTLLSSLTRSGKSFNIPLKNMIDGTYTIEVNDGRNSYRQQLVVKHN